jgi:hypothetical protein
MKTLTLIALAAGAAFTCIPAHADAQIFHGAYATSPAHPATWVAGASRANQGLRWDDKLHQLVADVRYSTRDWADSIHPAQDDDFVLPFPSVHFDLATKTFTANGVVIGTLRDGFWGHEVVLNPDVALSIHRHHGVVKADLIRQDAADY